MLNLYAALASLKNPDEVFRFMKDLCSPAELKEFENRWQVAELLHEGDLSYRDIALMIKTSPTTVTRVAKVMNDQTSKSLKGAIVKQSTRRRKYP